MDPIRTPFVAAHRRPRRIVLGLAAFGLVGLVLIGPLTGSALAAGHAVRIVDTGGYDSAFSPRSIKIGVGDNITWTNASGSPHNVTFASFGSPTYMDPGARYGHRFNQPGTFHYTCTLHGFSGTVVVSGPKPTPKPTAKPVPTATASPTASPTAKPVPTSKPTAKPVPTATVGPTASVATEAAGAPTSAPATATFALGAVLPTAAESAASRRSPTSSSSDIGGATPVILLGLLAVSAVGVGFLVRRHR